MAARYCFLIRQGPSEDEADLLTRGEQWGLIEDLRAWRPDEVALIELRAVGEVKLTDLGGLMGVSRISAGQRALDLLTC
jgi:hypothetical protein